MILHCFQLHPNATDKMPMTEMSLTHCVLGLRFWRGSIICRLLAFWLWLVLRSWTFPKLNPFHPSIILLALLYLAPISSWINHSHLLSSLTCTVTGCVFGSVSAWGTRWDVVEGSCYLASLMRALICVSLWLCFMLVVGCSIAQCCSNGSMVTWFCLSWIMMNDGVKLWSNWTNSYAGIIIASFLN